MHGVGMYFERCRSGGLGLKWGIISCSLFCRVLFMLNLLCLFYYWFFPFFFGCVLFSKIKLFGLGLSFDFFVFYLFVVRLESSLQKNKLSSFKLVFIRFGYRGFYFLSHAVGLWFLMFSKLRWLIWIII